MLKLPQAEIPLSHYFAPGIYLREMRMPKGALVTGRIHKTEHYCILSQGQVTVQTETGRQTFTAPAVIHSMPGTKRALYAHEQVTWINVHHNPTNEQDLDKIEGIFTVETYAELPGSLDPAKLEGGR